MPHGSAFHLSGGMSGGVIKLNSTVKEPLVLSRSLQLTDVSLQIYVQDSIKIFVLSSLSLKGVAITFTGIILVLKELFDLPNAEAYSEPCQTSKIERFAKIHYGYKSSTIHAKPSILNV